jgi:nucleoside-diphosphate-sugar epimerase
MQSRKPQRVLVTGGAGFLGFQVLLALVALGAQVTALIRADREESLEPLREQINVVVGDVWNKASLKGRARNHDIVVHLIGSARVDPQRGLTYDQVNLTSARNVIGMAISDGVPHVVLLSTVLRPLELSGAYVRSKRDAENLLRESGVHWTIIRAPALFFTRQSPVLGVVALLGGIFPFNMVFGRYLPLPVERAARGIAGIAMQPNAFEMQTVYAPRLRRVNRLVLRLPAESSQPAVASQTTSAGRPEDEDDEYFGWTPPH